MDGQAVRITRLGIRQGLCKLKPGFVKRVPAIGPLLGYYVGCPACGFKNIFMEGLEECDSGLTLRDTARCGSPVCRLVFNIRDDVLHFSKGTHQ